MWPKRQGLIYRAHFPYSSTVDESYPEANMISLSLLVKHATIQPSNKTLYVEGEKGT